jgi:putative NIF3 family GTP cyclohydrolase 1 type 2
LDGHPGVGNNALLLQAVGAEMQNVVKDLIYVGTFPEKISVNTNYILRALAESGLDKPQTFFSYGPREITKVAVCSGGAPDYIDEAAAAGAQLYITGEAREHTQQRAKDLGIHFMSYGHHNTETFGVKALAEYIRKTYVIPAEFFNVPNPV